MGKVNGVYLDTEKVRTMLRERKMSAEDVAVRCGRGERWLIDVLRNPDRRVSRKSATFLAFALGFTVEEIVCDEPKYVVPETTPKRDKSTADMIASLCRQTHKNTLLLEMILSKLQEMDTGGDSE